MAALELNNASGSLWQQTLGYDPSPTRTRGPARLYGVKTPMFEHGTSMAALELNNASGSLWLAADK